MSEPALNIRDVLAEAIEGGRRNEDLVHLALEDAEAIHSQLTLVTQAALLRLEEAVNEAWDELSVLEFDVLQQFQGGLAVARRKLSAVRTALDEAQEGEAGA